MGRMKEAFLSNKIELIGLIENELRKKNIPYELKTVNSGVQNRTVGIFLGRLGQKVNMPITLEIKLAQMYLPR